MNIFETLLTQPLANGLVVFYKLFGNMGLAIIGFSIFLRLILNPLTKPYMESMKKMKGIAPKLDKLKKKYKGDRIKFAQAQADLYKENNINPGAGCLPYILQIVVLIAFFNVFTRVLSPNGDVVQKFNELLYNPLKFEESATINTHFFYLDITQPDKVSLPSIPFSLPGPILILAAITQLISAKVMQPFTDVEEKLAKKTPGEEDDMQVAMQKSMVYTFPLITLFIGLRFPSGLALYWFMFSLIQTIQQVRAQGWGGLTPWIKKLNLIKSQS